MDPKITCDDNKNRRNDDVYDDDFGDDSFLDDFDVDAAVASAAAAQGIQPKRSSQENQESERRSKRPQPQPERDSSNKRIQVLGNNHDNVQQGSTTGSTIRKNPYHPSAGFNHTEQEQQPQQLAPSFSTTLSTGFGGDAYDSGRTSTTYDGATSKRHYNREQREALERTLSKYFGYSHFRAGQYEVLDAIVYEKKDVAVFWATGQGKSLCYQIPALFWEGTKVVIVVSPLISLMQDQVHKINSLTAAGGGFATYLGTGQPDPTAERKALQQGSYPLVYMTPEKLSSSLQQLSRLHSHVKEIGLIAIDEAHCVSEWGHDFRPEYRRIGDLLRGGKYPVLQAVPMVALTATATPRVQTDLVRTLKFRPERTAVANQSLDRPNLSIRIAIRTESVAKTLEPLLRELRRPNVRPSQQTTIVYAPTQKLVEEIASFLQQNLEPIDNGITVEYYHGGCTQQHRARVHSNFVTSQTTVAVATVAFGMGIDKIDTRRVVHYQPPKTVEEYYQQIGRAGRDGLPAECYLFASPSDFDKYRGDFYLGKLCDTAKRATEASIDAFKSFCLSKDTCRRAALLRYFGQTPPFGEHCGSCDVCLSLHKYGNDAARDLGPLGAYVVLRAVSDLTDASSSTILDAVAGTKQIPSCKYKRGTSPSSSQQRIATLKDNIPKKEYLQQKYYKELVPTLVQKKYLTETSKRTTVNGYARTWTIYNITLQGQKALQQSLPIVLPVPDTIRQAEQKEEERRLRMLAKLEKHGISQDKLPPEEVKTGQGEVTRAFTKWITFMENTLERGNAEKHAQLQRLMDRIESWRSQTAIQQCMAPAAVMAEHIMYAVAYATATMPLGQKLDAASLHAVGVRSKEIGGLVHVLDSWVDEARPAATAITSSSTGSNVLGHTTTTTRGVPLMYLDSTSLVKGNVKGAWAFAIIKPAKKKGAMPVWEQSYVRCCKDGETIEAVAMTPSGGRQPIQAKTVAGHLMDAILYGRTDVDANQIARFVSLPNQNEWDRLAEAETRAGMDVAGHPDTSGRDGGKVAMVDLLRSIVGDDLVDKKFNERSEQEKEIFSLWCDKARWYMLFRRIGYQPTFV